MWCYECNSYIVSNVIQIVIYFIYTFMFHYSIKHSFNQVINKYYKVVCDKKFGDVDQTTENITNLLGGLNLSDKKCKEIKTDNLLELLRLGQCNNYT